MRQKILVPLDGSGAAEPALDVALRIAQYEDDEVLLLCIPTGQLLSSVPAGEVATEKLAYGEAQKYLDTVRQSRLPAVCSVKAQVKRGNGRSEATIILETAVAEDIALIVMTPHVHSLLDRWLGGVTERVLRDAPCPVLVVRSAQPPRKVLVPLDGSDLAESALAPAVSIGQRLQAQLTLLHVLEGTADIASAGIGQLETLERGFSRFVEEDVVEKAEEYLQEIVQALQPQVEQTVQTAVVPGATAQKIVDFAGEHQIDLIVMATRGRTGISHLLFGSVTETVFRRTDSALLAVHPPP